MAYKGEVRLIAGTYAPAGWSMCTGGSGIPDLRGRVVVHADASAPLGQTGGSETVALTAAQLPVHRHVAMCAGDATTSAPVEAIWAAITTENSAPYAAAPANLGMMASSCIVPMGDGEAHDNMMPFLALNYITPTVFDGQDDDDPYLGEIRAFAGGADLQPGWVPCDGTMLPVRQFAALFSLLGVSFGGDGRTEFAVPDLAETVVLGAGDGDGLSPRPFASKGGADDVALDLAQLPPHTHVPTCSTGTGDAAAPSQNLWASDPAGNMQYDTSEDEDMATGILLPNGGNAPHENRQPFLAIRYMLCVQGIYPPHAGDEVK